MGGLFLARATEQLVAPRYGEDYWLNHKANNLALKRILDFLAEEAPATRCAPALDAANRVVVAVDRPDRRETILFPARFPLEPPVLGVEPVDGAKPSFLARLFGAKRGPAEPEAGAASAAPDAPAWDYTGDIVLSFTNWYRAAFAPADEPQPTKQETSEP